MKKKQNETISAKGNIINSAKDNITRKSQSETVSGKQKDRKRNYEDMVRFYMPDREKCKNCFKYSKAGTGYYTDGEFYKGDYWYYESEDFIVDIHNFYIKKDYVETNVPDLSDYMFLVSNYMISGSGEWLDPYQVIEPGSMFIMDTQAPLKRYILHGNARFYVVGMKFKEKMIEQQLVKKMDLKKSDISKIFIETQKDIVKPISKIAEEILNCRMDGFPAELFFEAKAKEWLSITLDAYKNLKNQETMSEFDKNSIDSVAKYIENHYAFDIPQSFLEKIAAMSGTKLKETFKQRYKMSITEFTQRKRMNIAENLLMTTDMEIRDISKSVGYNSPSRFSTLFKRYKGVYPKDIKNTGAYDDKFMCECKIASRKECEK